jgi:serine/alanine adding enzyme
MLKEFVYTTDDWNSWNSALSAQKSVFGSIEFARIVQEHLAYEARLYVLQDDTCQIAYPFFSRPVPSLPLVGVENVRLSDTVSPEYTGPLVRGAPVQHLAIEFLQRFSMFAFNHSVVAEFIHLHPWKAFTSVLLGNCLEFNREIVYVDLTRTDQQLWRTSFTKACRQNINRSQRENVRVFEAQTMGDIREFHRLYVETMKRRNALDHYYFSLDYFSAFFDHLRRNSRFVLAEYRNQLIAGILYLHDRDDVYSYLGGADYNFQHVRPTNAVIYDTILWGKRQGKKRLVLGGGCSPNDGIFRFKASFSPERTRFFVYKRVHIPDKYAALCRSWSSIYGQASQSTAYFPQYRFQPTSESSKDSCNAATTTAK